MTFFLLGAKVLIRKIRRKAAHIAANMGVSLLYRSVLYSDFFGDWRWAIFDKAEKLGFHILPVHYYTPIPAFDDLNHDERPPLLASASDEVLDSATTALSNMVGLYQDDYSEIANRKPFEAHENISEFRLGKAPYSSWEAELLYGLIRSTRQTKRRPRL